MAGDRLGVLAAVEERFLVPAYTSRHAGRWIAGHRTLAWPLTRRGPLRRYAASLEGGEVHIACVGRSKRFETLLVRLGALPMPGIPRALSLRSPAALAALDADLVLVHVHRWAAHAFREGGWYTIPDAVRWCGATAEVPPRHPSRSLVRELRKIERQGFTLEIADHARDWDVFFEEMVLPTASARFGAAAWTPSTHLRRIFTARGRVHFVRKGSERVAGAAVLPRPGGLWLPIAGVRGGDPVLLAAGAASAALALTVRWAAAHGHARIDVGRTTPFVHDGIARFKRKWGFRPEPDPLAHLVALRVNSACMPLRAFFHCDPVLHETGTGLAVLGGDDAGA